MLLPDPDPVAAVERLVEATRALNDARASDDIARLLADAVEGGPARVVAVFVTSADGTPALAELRGAPAGAIVAADLLDTELGAHTVGGVPGVGHVSTHLLLSGGGLFGAIVLGYDAPPSPLEELVERGIGDAGAAALDRAFRTAELLGTIEDLHRSQEQLARTEALRRLGQLAAVVAHEVKNPLASIGGVLQVLNGRFPSGSPDQQIVEKVLGRLGDLDQMVNEILQFARPQQLQRVLVDVRGMLVETSELFRRSPDTEGIEVELECPATVRARLDRPKLQRVLLNLMINAAQAMDGAGTLRLCCQQQETTVAVAVSDDGPGVPEHLREHLFEPFVTTKTRGTGLGLAVARQVTEAHGGVIRLADTERGARFEITLPLV